MNINWKVRVKNPLWWGEVLLSVIMPVATYFGLKAADITSWSILFNTMAEAVKNPYVIGLVLVSVWNAVIDPTTAGIGDSAQARTYNAPRKDG